MRLVVSKNPFLIMVMILSMLAPMFLMEGANAMETQSPHQHAKTRVAQLKESVAQPHSKNSHLDAGVTASIAAENLSDVPSSAASTECHHIALQDNCSVHCSSSSCTSILMGFKDHLATAPTSALHTTDTAKIPAPRPPSIHRPPLTTG